MSRVPITISVHDAHIGRIDEIAKALQKAGMTVEQRLPDLGVLTGSAEAAEIKRLKQVEGVSAVEQGRGFAIAPPETPVQ